MAINPHDDYEALAKLLYPSIEASGNVYYGQTRKLTMDETLGKNDLGFESHIESKLITNCNPNIYVTYFCWKLGPLKGSIELKPFDDKPKSVNINNTFLGESVYRIKENGDVDEIDPNTEQYVEGTFFAKYELKVTSNSVDNVISSGNFKSYENNIEASFVGIYVTENFDPTNPLGYNIYDIADRHFYIQKDSFDSKVYLYIQLLSANITDDEKYPPLTLIARGGTGAKIWLRQSHSDYIYLARTKNSNGWKYSDDGSIAPWETSGTVSGPCITISDGEYVQFKCTRWREHDIGDNFNTIYSESTYFYIELTNGPATSSRGVEVTGDIRSMLSENYSTLYDISDYTYAFCRLFKAAANTNVKQPIIKYPSILPAYVLSKGCYYNMLSCDYDSNTDVGYNDIVTKIPKLPAKTLVSECYYALFYGMSSISSIVCNAYYANAESCCTQWLRFVQNNGIFHGRSAHVWPEAESPQYYGIPFGWQRVEYTPDPNVDDVEHIRISWPKNGFNCAKALPVIEDSYEDNTYYKQDYLVTSGSDSASNGRGSILEESTVVNMKRSFDENGTHQFDTYNTYDGSYNQEIWGYKSFNSPVQFRNGIYGECASLIALPNSCYPDNSKYRKGVALNTLQDGILRNDRIANGESSFITKSYVSEHTTLSNTYYSFYTAEVRVQTNEILHNQITGYSSISANTEVYGNGNYISSNEYTVNIETADIDGNNKASIQLKSDLKSNESSITTTGAIIPSSNLTDDIGSSNYRYKNIHSYNLDISGTVSGDILPSTGNVYDIGSSDNRYKNVYGDLYGDFRHPTIYKYNNQDYYTRVHDIPYTGSVLLMAFIKMVFIYDINLDFSVVTDLSDQINRHLKNVPCIDAGVVYEIATKNSTSKWPKINNKFLGSEEEQSDDAKLVISYNNYNYTPWQTGDSLYAKHAPTLSVNCLTIDSNGSFTDSQKAVDNLTKFVILNNIRFSISNSYSSANGFNTLTLAGMALIQTIK